MFLLIVKSQGTLFDAPVHIAAHVRKDGTVVKPHVRVQKIAVHQPSHQRTLFGDNHHAPAPAKKRSKLDAWIEKKGGAASLAKILAQLTDDQQENILAEMGKLDGGKSAAEVRAMLPHIEQAKPAQDDLFSQKDAQEDAQEKPAEKQEEPAAPEPEAEAEPAKEPEAPAAEQPALVEYTTKKGKVLRGIVRTDLNGHEAAAIDPYTFRYQGGWFIREKHLGNATAPAATFPAQEKPQAEPAAPAGPTPEELAARAQAQAAAQAQKLREAGEKLKASAEADMRRDRLSNTSRRARMAASAEADAARRLATANTMINLAGAIESGEARWLKNVSTRAAVEALDAEIRRAVIATDRELSYVDQQRNKGRAVTPEDIRNAKMTRPSWSNAGADKSGLLEKLKGKRGAKALADEIRGSFRPTAEQIAKLKKFVTQKDLDYALGWYNLERVAHVARMERLGIKTDDDLRLALAEYMTFRDGPQAADPVKAAERAIVGQKVGFDFFPTPKAVAERMVEEAGIKPGMRVLEPSGGSGIIADAARAAGADVDVVEISDALRNVLTAKKHKLVDYDFEKFQPEGQYDAVVMNPPFSNRLDAAHIMRAWDMVKPGGSLVAIAGEGVFFGSDQKAQGFRDWLATHDAEVEKLPEKTFMGSQQAAQTGANSRLIVMRKPAAADAGPKEGDVKTEDGIQYVLQDGRWHRVTPEEQVGEAPTVEFGPEILDTAVKESSAVGGMVGYALETDVQGVIPGKPRELDRLLAKGTITEDEVKAKFAGTLAAMRAKYGDRVTLWRSDAPDAQKSADSKTVYMAGQDEATKYAVRGRVAKPYVVSMDDVLGVYAKRSGYYEVIVKLPDGGLVPADEQSAAQEPVEEPAPQAAEPVAEQPAAEPAPEPEAAAEEPRAVDPDFEQAEDREDLAGAMMRDPHSEETRKIIRRIAQKESAAHESVSLDEDDPNSPNYRFRDTGHIAGSRKEKAAEAIKAAGREGRQMRATDIDWDEIEQNPRQAEELITKSNLFGRVDWAGLKEGGMLPAAGFLIDRIYASIGTEPEAKNTQARKDYAIGLESLRARLESCKTPEQVTDVLAEIRDELTGTQLNEEESAQLLRLREQIPAIKAEQDQIRELNDKAYMLQSNIRARMWALEHEIAQRKRRGWQEKPELAAELAQVSEEYKIAEKLWGDGLRKFKPREDALRAQASALYEAMDRVKQGAKIRNVMENQATRSWATMGGRFLSLVNWRSMKGSDAFAKHVTAAKTGKIPDWSWAEKEVTKAPRPTKREVGFQLKVAEQLRRVGGREIAVNSTAMLKDRYGLREVQSGNWVLKDPTSAAYHVQASAEAFADLADLIGVPDEVVAMNGRLAMAFGARGTGNTGFGGAARAHYEPVERVINLTKMGGGGSLGHEWFHALDNLVFEAEGLGAANKNTYLTEQPHLLPAGELRDAFQAVKDAIHAGAHAVPERHKYSAKDVRMAQYNIDPTGGSYSSPIAQAIRGSKGAQDAVKAVDNYFSSRYGDIDPKSRMAKQRKQWRTLAVAYHDKNPAGAEVWLDTGKGVSSFMREAIALDGGAEGKYWSETREMAARAFQSWVEDKLEAQGRRNDYLSVFADNKYHVDPLFGPQFPYPDGEERKTLNAAFDRLMAAIASAGTLQKALAMMHT